jgi:hypothetical protein
MIGKVGIDLDPRNGSAETVARWKAEGRRLTLTRWHASGRGEGNHLIYQADEELAARLNNQKPGKGIDLKSGPGSYLVLPPTPHDEGERGPYRVVCPLAPQPLDPWVAELVLADQNSNGHKPTIDLDEVFRGLGKGTRDQTAYDLACRYRGKGLREEEALVLVAEWWSRMEQPPGDTFTWEQAQEKVHRAYREHESEFEKEVAKRQFWKRVDREAERRSRAEEVADSAPPPSPLTLAEELAEVEDEELLTWTVTTILPEGHNVSLTGEFKTGKTTLADVNLTRALVDGGRFLGVFPTHLAEGRVGIWNYEVAKRQFRLWMREANIQHPERVSVEHLRGHRLDLLSEAGQQWAVGWLREREVRVWLLDPWALLLSDAGLGENDNTEARRLLRVLDRIKEQAGVSNLLVTHHTGRQDKERARGATALDDWADTRWLVVRETQDGQERRYFRTLPSRDVETNEWQLGFNAETRRLEVVGPGRRLGAEERRQHHLLVAINNTPGIKAEELRLAVGGDKSKLPGEVRRLADSGLVVTEEGPPPGRPTLHYLTELGRARLAELEGRLV